MQQDNLMKLIQINNPLGDKKRKLTGTLLFLIVLIFEKYFQDIYMIEFKTRQYVYPKEVEGKTQGKL